MKAELRAFESFVFNNSLYGSATCDSKVYSEVGIQAIPLIKENARV